MQCRYIAGEILSGVLPRSVQCSVFCAVHSKSWSPRGGVSTIQTVCRTSDGPSRRISSSTPLLGPQERRPSNIRAAQLITLPQRSKFQPTLVLQDCRRTVSATASKYQRPAGVKRFSDRPAAWPVSRLLLQADDKHPIKPYTRTPLFPSLLSPLLLCSSARWGWVFLARTERGARGPSCVLSRQAVFTSVLQDTISTRPRTFATPPVQSATPPGAALQHGRRRNRPPGAAL